MEFLEIKNRSKEWRRKNLSLFLKHKENTKEERRRRVGKDKENGTLCVCDIKILLYTEMRETPPFSFLFLCCLRSSPSPWFNMCLLSLLYLFLILSAFVMIRLLCLNYYFKKKKNKRNQTHHRSLTWF